MTRVEKVLRVTLYASVAAAASSLVWLIMQGAVRASGIEMLP